MVLPSLKGDIFQENSESIEIRNVPNGGFHSDDIRTILDVMRLRLVQRIAMYMSSVESIPYTSNGKARFMISRVRLEVGSNLTEPKTPELRLKFEMQ